VGFKAGLPIQPDGFGYVRGCLNPTGSWSLLEAVQYNMALHHISQFPSSILALFNVSCVSGQS